MEAPTLTTERLILRAISIDDWSPYAAMWADARVTHFIGGEPRTPKVAWPKFVQGAGFWPLFGYGYWSVLTRAGGYLGVGGFARHVRGIAELGDFPECGWSFVPDCWGQGIASEAVAAICNWADATGLGETRCLISKGNVASVRVAERNGYTGIAVLDDDACVFTRPAPAGWT